MRGLGMLVIAGLVLTLGATADLALAVERDPFTGGLVSLPGADPTPEANTATPVKSPTPAAVSAESGKVDDTAWGVLVRGGYFGLPNAIMDQFFIQHPDIAGSSFGAEIRYHGEGGGRGGSSIGLSVDSATVRADGTWQQVESDEPEHAAGEIRILAVALTGYWSLFPSWYVHPYAGIGVGVVHAVGSFEDETERVDIDYWVPAVHIPVGLAFEFGKRLQLAVEGRFIDGIAIGGALQVRF